MKKQAVTKEDFIMPEFRGANPEDYEFRGDGKIVRKDRWEQGIRRIVGILGMDSGEFEIDDVIKEVQTLYDAPKETLEMSTYIKNHIEKGEFFSWLVNNHSIDLIRDTCNVSIKVSGAQSTINKLCDYFTPRVEKETL